jgi:hypothetical protein
MPSSSAVLCPLPPRGALPRRRRTAHVARSGCSPQGDCAWRCGIVHRRPTMGSAMPSHSDNHRGDAQLRGRLKRQPPRGPTRLGAVGRMGSTSEMAAPDYSAGPKKGSWQRLTSSRNFLNGKSGSLTRDDLTTGERQCQLPIATPLLSVVPTACYPPRLQGLRGSGSSEMDTHAGNTIPRPFAG